MSGLIFSPSQSLSPPLVLLASRSSSILPIESSQRLCIFSISHAFTAFLLLSCLTFVFFLLILCSGVMQNIILITNSFPTWLNPVTDMDNGFTVNFPVFIRYYSPRRFTSNLDFSGAGCGLKLKTFSACFFLSPAIADYEDTCLLSTPAFNSFK